MVQPCQTKTTGTQYGENIEMLTLGRRRDNVCSE